MAGFGFGERGGVSFWETSMKNSQEKMIVCILVLGRNPSGGEAWENNSKLHFL